MNDSKYGRSVAAQSDLTRISWRFWGKRVFIRDRKKAIVWKFKYFESHGKKRQKCMIQHVSTGFMWAGSCSSFWYRSWSGISESNIAVNPTQNSVTSDWKSLIGRISFIHCTFRYCFWSVVFSDSFSISSWRKVWKAVIIRSTLASEFTYFNDFPAVESFSSAWNGVWHEWQCHEFPGVKP